MGVYSSGTSAITGGKLTAAATPAGRVIQVVSTIKTNVFIGTATYGNWTAITGLSASITPSSTSNKIMIMCSINYDSTRGNSGGGFSIFRAGSLLTSAIGDANGSNYRVFGDLGANANADQSGMNRVIMFLDSPSSTSSLTYDIRFTQDTNSFTTYINKARYDDGGGQTDDGRFASSITLMEITG